MDKRSFLRAVGGTSLGLTLGATKVLFAERAHVNPADLARDEAFWATVRAKFRLKADYINLENGYYCLQPQEVLEAFIDRVREVNTEGSYYMRTRQVEEKLRVRKRLAAMAGCSYEELIITRNTTESLDTVIAGFDWKAGDEAVMAEQDYGAMLDMFDLQARRHGIVNRRVSLPLDPQSDDEIVELYANAITPKTRLLMVGHMVNITGQILPVRKIVDMAHRKGVLVMVDGAHAFAQIDFRIPG
jgi:selenocysteine lyase/cysteine desulfurase